MYQVTIELFSGNIAKVIWASKEAAFEHYGLVKSAMREGSVKAVEVREVKHDYANKN